MTVDELKQALEGVPGSWPVYFRKVAPGPGNVVLADAANTDTVAFFGIPEPCIIIEPRGDTE